MIYTDINDIDNKYQIIYSDPPWIQKKGGKKAVRPNSSGKELDYQTMELPEIIEFHRHIFENNTEEKHNVFMWTIDKYLRQTEDFMLDLGYKIHARMIWNKVTGVPAAFTVRYAHEYLLWCYKKGGIIKPRDEVRGVYSDVFTEQVTKHSKKPECVYLMLEDMFPSESKLELFARNTRDGWDSFGNEIK